MALFATLAAIGAAVAPLFGGGVTVVTPAVSLLWPLTATVGVMTGVFGGMFGGAIYWFDRKVQYQAEIEKQEYQEFRKFVIFEIITILISFLIITSVIIWMKRRKKQAERAREEPRQRWWFYRWAPGNRDRREHQQ